MDSTCTDTRVAPWASAARRMVATVSTTSSSSPSMAVPNGPISTSSPAAVAASNAACTWGPGSPAVKGSTVNSACSVTAPRLPAGSGSAPLRHAFCTSRGADACQNEGEGQPGVPSQSEKASIIAFTSPRG